MQLLAATIETAIGLAKDATDQSDRYLFIITLFVLALSCYFAFGYLIRHHEKQIVKSDSEREQFQMTLIDLVKQTTDVVRENTEVNRRIIPVLDRVEHDIHAK